MALILIVLALVALDVAALLWGVDLREGPNDPEWEARKTWYARSSS